MSILITTSYGENLVEAGVIIGDKVIASLDAWLVKDTKTLTLGIDYSEIYVTAVATDSVSIEAYINNTPVGIDNRIHPVSVSLDFVRELSKDAQVDVLTSLAKSYNNKRVVLVWPPKADWTIDGDNTISLDGTALAAVTAAAKSAYPAHQSFTNLSFPGPQKLYYSNTYFTPSQLNKLSDAGLFVLVQDAVGGEIYARHQKTTSTTSIQEQELSITNAVDKVSIDLYSTVKPFIGKYNVTQDLLTQLQDVIKEYLYAAKSKKSAYCGSLIINSKNLVIRANLEGQNTDLTPGVVEISVTVEVGYPANYIDINILVN